MTAMIKRIGTTLAAFVLTAFIASFLCGCQTPLPVVDYSQSSNWFICDKDATASEGYDVFYVYPALFSSKDVKLMDRDDPNVYRKALNFAKAQTDLFNGDARVFAPFVRQLEYQRCLEDCRVEASDWINTGMQTGILDTRKAFRYYIEHWNGKRPFVLLGHSQGAIDLYELLRTTESISPDNGFVAAYLLGLPKITAAKINSDLVYQKITAATEEKEPGVVIVWNTQSPTVEQSVFAEEGTYCINPLNWRCDEVPANADRNIESRFYRFGEKDPAKQFWSKKKLCGAAISLKKGALIVDLPEYGEYDANALMGSGVFHVSDIWLFSGCIRKNAATRVASWLERK